MGTKDLFSGHSKKYAAFRPTYPEALYRFIFDHVAHKGVAWDCATGNGQVARFLSEHFQKVYATDISQQQLDQAFRAPNIFYSISPAEKTTFLDQQFDLVTVGQALHWFDQPKFFEEVKRVGKRQSIVAIWGYALLYIEPTIDKIILDFYHHTVGSYWDEARRMVEKEYSTIDFPFHEIAAPKLNIEVTWTIDHLLGYLESWSATQKYIQANGHNPVEKVAEKIRSHWKTGESKNIRFPVFTRIGKVQ